MNDFGTLWFFWGQERMTFLRAMTLRSACRIHGNVALITRPACHEGGAEWKERQDFQFNSNLPDWSHTLDALPIRRLALRDFAPDIADLSADDVHTADLLRWKILAEYGGTVADMDIVFIRPLPAVDADVKIVRFSGHPKPGYAPVSFMQGRPCETWRIAFARAWSSYDPATYESCGSGVIPDAVPGALDEHIIFPWAGEHPWSLWRDWMFTSDKWPAIPSTCCGIHWYAGHNQAFNQALRNPGDMRTGALRWAVSETMNP